MLGHVDQPTGQFQITVSDGIAQLRRAVLRQPTLDQGEQVIIRKAAGVHVLSLPDCGPSQYPDQPSSGDQRRRSIVSRNAARARNSRDFTVPSGMSRASAI